MSSANKTTNLQLNKWSGSDIPERTDFVRDNELIDKAVHNHRTDMSIHIDSDEREKWNNFYHKFTYVGNGSSTRTVTSDCPFIPSWGIIFASSMMPSVIDIANDSNYNYFGIFSNIGNTAGVSIAGGNNLKVYQSATAIMNTEYRNYNQNGIVYCVIMFR